MELDFDQIKQLMAELESSGLTRLRIKTEALELELERKLAEVAPVLAPQPQPVPPSGPLPAVPQVALQAAPPPPPPEPEGEFVSSPMVGTFYRSPSPEDLPFVREGDRVDAESIVCIIEAMKVMNEVKAGAAGVIKKVLVDNGQPVEFGSPLFELVPG